jgi:hypothetical protein
LGAEELAGLLLATNWSIYQLLLATSGLDQLGHHLKKKGSNDY